MTEQHRSRRPSTDRAPAARKGGSRARAGGPPGGVQTLEDPEPSLGDVKFDEWFQTPVFESDTDERLEELATTRRGPMRLAASTFLRLNARAEQVRRRGDPSERPHPAEAAPEAAAPRPAEERSDRLRRPAPAARSTSASSPSAPARPARSKPRSRPLTSARPTPAPTPAPAPTRAPAPAPAAVQADLDAEMQADLAWAAGLGSVPAAAVATGRSGDLRRRFNAALDRWAEREAATQARLERLFLPKRWQA